jgi:hypothetical protein
MVISSHGQLLGYQFVLSSEESGQLHGQVFAGPDASLYIKAVTPNGLAASDFKGLYNMNMSTYRLAPSLLIGLLITACSASSPTQASQNIPTPAFIPPPVQGPAVVGQGVEIESWEYHGSNVVESLPLPSANVRAVDFSYWEARLIRTENGFEFVWGELPCATQPVVIVHAEATIEFWPRWSISPYCEAREAFHKLSVQWETDVPFDEWEFIFHPPPAPEA